MCRLFPQQTRVVGRGRIVYATWVCPTFWILTSTRHLSSFPNQLRSFWPFSFLWWQLLPRGRSLYGEVLIGEEDVWQGPGGTRLTKLMLLRCIFLAELVWTTSTNHPDYGVDISSPYTHLRFTWILLVVVGYYDLGLSGPYSTLLRYLNSVCTSSSSIGSTSLSSSTTPEWFSVVIVMDLMYEMD